MSSARPIFVQAPGRRAARRSCRWTNLRCYFPTLVAMLLVGLAIAYGTYLMQGSDLTRISGRHYVNGVLLWFVMSPVVLGLARGTRRSLRHMKRAGRR
ncbi:MAG: hypothetical protein HUU35_18185 [Armatimonadetes bacterium]|nr:hypothetical protein [Armatimonadota bacterium]